MTNRQEESQSVAEFFDSISDDYTEAIVRCVPRYSEILTELMSYLPESFDRSGLVILELGAGTGNLSLLLNESFESPQLKLVDISKEALEICRRRMPENVSAEYFSDDFRDLKLPPESVDWIVSSISLHHLRSSEKAKLIQESIGWLRPGGVITIADQFRGSNPLTYRRHLERWHQHAIQAGVPDQEWQAWMKHQNEHDYHDTATDHLTWLQQAGFERIDCLWRNWMWTIVQGHKPGQDAA